MKNAIVTGAAGYIGSKLVKVLSNKGITVYAVDLNADRLSTLFSGCQFIIPVVVDTLENLKEFLDSSIEYDVFFHFAWRGGFTDAIGDYHIQIENIRNSCFAIEACKDIFCKKFVFAGTVNEYEIIDYLTDNYCKPRNTCIYGTAKTASEMMLKTLANRYSIQFCSGLIPMIYGEDNKSKQLINIVVSQLIRGLSPKLIEGNNLYDIVHVSDVAEAFYYLGLYGKPQVTYYVGHSKLKTFRMWMEEIRDILAPDVELKFGEYSDNLSIHYERYDLNLLKQDTGFEVKRELRDELPLYAEWVKRLEI